MDLLRPLKIFVQKVKGPSRCPFCKRSLDEAINEQINKKLPCDCEIGQCFFANQISEAILLAKEPEIVKFHASKREVLDNEIFTISWEVVDSKSVSIIGIGVVNPFGDYEIQLNNSSDLSLVVESYANKKITSVLPISVYPAPLIKKFAIDKTKVIKGEQVKIEWSIENTISSFLIINEQYFNINDNDYLLLSPNENTDIEIKVTGALNSEISNIINVLVFEAGKINYFKADRLFVFPTIPVTLSWDVENAIKVEIEGVGDVKLFGQIIVQPTVDKTYKLIVTDNFGTFSEQIQIKMFPLPFIEKFIIPIPIVYSFSNILIEVPNFSMKNLELPKSTGLINTVYECNINTTLYQKNPKVKEIDFKTLRIPFIKRIKNILSFIKEEFTNEKNKKYVTKKQQT